MVPTGSDLCPAASLSSHLTSSSRITWQRDNTVLSARSVPSRRLQSGCSLPVHCNRFYTEDKQSVRAAVSSLEDNMILIWLLWRSSTVSLYLTLKPVVIITSSTCCMSHRTCHCLPSFFNWRCNVSYVTDVKISYFRVSHSVDHIF